MGQKGREDVENKDGWTDGWTADGRNKEKRKKKKPNGEKKKKVRKPQLKMHNHTHRKCMQRATQKSGRWREGIRL